MNSVGIVVTFLVSLIPVLESRAAIPLGMGAWKLTPLVAFLASAGSAICLAVLLAYCLDWLNRLLSPQQNFLGRLWNWTLNRSARKFSPSHWRSKLIGLIIFIAIPLPGTGVWTGSIAGYLLGLKPWQIGLAGAIGGTIAAGVITLATAGVIKLAI
ncbi:MAG: small multi-drug export protein [bacterium]